MDPSILPRRLTVILHADVHGYSRLIEHDEVATLRVLTPSLQLMAELVRRHGGRPIGSRGDSLLAEFPSARSAVQCAVAMQREVHERTAALPAAQRLAFRMGIHVGEVVEDGEQLHGDGINIAVRLEGMAEPGGICLSDAVYNQVKNKLPLQYEDLGRQQLKNIAEPVRVYRVVLEGQRPTVTKRGKLFSSFHPGKRSWMRAVGAGMVVLLLVGGIGTVWYFFSPPPRSPHSEIYTQGALPLPDKPSIVVLPFTNMSGDPGQDYFSDGLTEVLTSDLSTLTGLFVIARNSAFTYKGRAVKVQEVGRELGVRYVLEGSVQKTGDRIRVTAELVDAPTGHQLWAERYDRPLQDIFALQDEIVQKIITTLKLQLGLQEQGYIVRKHTDHLEAYDYFLRGLEYFWRFTPEANAQARQMYEKAIALDPQYAEAYARLGWTYLREWALGWSADPQTLERASALAQQAVALDDSLPIAHSFLGMVYTQQRQYDRAIAEGERAIALDPNNADSYARQAEALNFAGRPEDALRAVERAMRLNPRYPPDYLFRLGWAYHSTGRYAEAVATLQEAVRRSPNHLPAHLNLAVSYWLQWVSQQGPGARPLEEALAAVHRALALNNSWHLNRIFLGYIYLARRQYEQALAEMEQAVALAPTEAWGYAALADVLSRVGRSEDALEAAAQALRLKPFIVDRHLDSVGAAYALAGRPEAAVAPLKQFLSRYPNILGAHLTLVGVYSELGREAEARAEAAEVLRLNPHWSLEVWRQRVPIKDPARVERFLAALRKAGLK